MDQDLSLMKQLLILNETIEDLKWKRSCSYDSMPDSSTELNVSDWSVSDSDLFESCDDLSRKGQQPETEIPEVTSLSNAIKHKCTTQDTRSSTKKSEQKSEKISKIKIENAIYKQTSEEDQSSCDSGICDSFLVEGPWRAPPFQTNNCNMNGCQNLCSSKTFTIQEDFRGHWSLRSQDILAWTTRSGCLTVYTWSDFYNEYTLCRIS